MTKAQNYNGTTTTALNEIFWELITLSTTMSSCVGLVSGGKEML